MTTSTSAQRLSGPLSGGVRGHVSRHTLVSESRGVDWRLHRKQLLLGCVLLLLSVIRKHPAQRGDGTSQQAVGQLRSHLAKLQITEWRHDTFPQSNPGDFRGSWFCLRVRLSCSADNEKARGGGSACLNVSRVLQSRSVGSDPADSAGCVVRFHHLYVTSGPSQDFHLTATETREIELFKQETKPVSRHQEGNHTGDVKVRCRAQTPAHRVPSYSASELFVVFEWTCHLNLSTWSLARLHSTEEMLLAFGLTAAT
ncbi:unnamed protein product [Pleuronectes platessa]|uniref:Uncharacterized protein n=1 Tax=Pleuronectes platessa TaxID=8262 RepID=A0A9N7V6F8_PLEPL|nr:unnamed protein product [Pleuronectes platessa]